MAKITSRIGTDAYRIEIKSPTGNTVIADEPIDKGGKDAGFSPKELLASALAACTSATVTMYAERKQYALREVLIEIDLENSDHENRTVVIRRIEFVGDLDDQQRSRLMKVANACPIHKILTNPIEIITEEII
jgi:putative redox protein